MGNIRLVVFDMAGTTVKDENEVEKCITEAAQMTGLGYNSSDIISMMGWPKRKVFDMLWKKHLPDSDDSSIRLHSAESYQVFKVILENHYRTMPVLPTPGTLQLFSYLKTRGIRIALTTGFYREVTDIILERLGWDLGLDKNYLGNADTMIDISVSSDQVENGRPAPDMIFKAMSMLGIGNPLEVVNIGDTPSDLQSGRSAGCFLSLGVTNGTHTRQQLEQYENDGLIDNIMEMIKIID